MVKDILVLANKSINSQRIKQEINSQIKKSKYKLSKNSNNILVVGGDGSFIKILHKYINDGNKKILLINTGNAGFYASNIKINIHEIINFFENDNNFYCPNVIYCSINKKKYYAINEIVIHCLNLMSVNININNIYYHKFYGNGLCFCTKSGSTGWNKSLNGSILLTNQPTWQMTQISPNNQINKLSIHNSIILDKNHDIILNNMNANDDIFLIVDGVKHSLHKNEKIRFTLKNVKVKIINLNDIKNVINKLRKIFITNKTSMKQ